MSAASTMSATVVVATYNRATELRRLIAGLSAQVGATFDVIVVDDGSSPPATLDGLPADFAVQVLAQPNAGPGHARHEAIRRATGEIIVVVDDDMIVPPSFVAAHVRQHEAGNDVAIGRFKVVGEGTELLKFQMDTIDEYFDACEADRRLIAAGRLSTGNVSFRRALYESVGGFDLSLRRCEDKELGLRFADAGAQFGFATGADTKHHDKPVVREQWLRVAYEYGQADVQIAARHPSLREASPWHLLTSMNRPLQMLFALVIRWPWIVRPLDVIARLGGQTLRSMRLDSIGAKVSGLSWGLHYFVGVVDESGGPDQAHQSLRAYLDGS